MNYELAKELRDAGFPQDGGGSFYNAYPSDGGKDASVYYPLLSELIEACGEDFVSLSRRMGGTWHAKGCGDYDDDYTETSGSTPEEAVAKLWLALNK